MSEQGDLQIRPDADGVAHALAEAFVRAAGDAIAERGVFNVALSGGKTPRAGYELLATEPYRSQVDWSKVYVYFGDERCVPPSDERSNYRMAEQAFLGAVGVPRENVHRIRGEIDPGFAANEYASLLRTALGNAPQFDLVLLGLGEDGHTASLFPGTLPQVDDGALVRAVDAQPEGIWRVTITPRVINSAERVVFAVEGAEKASIFATVYAGPKDPMRYPAQLVAPSSGNLTWLVDTAAASALPR